VVSDIQSEDVGDTLIEDGAGAGLVARLPGRVADGARRVGGHTGRRADGKGFEGAPK
jgi:hypothetical protein